MKRFNALLASVVTFAVALGSLPAVSAQDKEDEIRLSTAEVLLDVIVTDGKGNPVTDLRADEVQVVEAGVQQDITSFALVKPGGGEPGAPAAPKAPASIELSPFRGFNFLILVVDRTTLDQFDLKETSSAAVKFINEKLGPNDLMAVFVAGSRLLMVQNFTNSKSKLLNAVGIATDSSGNVISLSTTDRNATRADISFDQAITGNVAVNPGAGGAAVGEAISSLDAFGADVNRTFDNLVDQFSAIALVQSLLALMKVYSRIPGRKAVLLYSEGFAVNSTVQGTFDAVLGTANRNNFSFYTVDAAGLRSIGQTRLEAPGASSVASGAGPTLANRGDRSVVDSSGNSAIGRAENSVRSGGNAALSRLAVETGGVAVRNTNDLGKGFQTVSNDLRSYYALAYAAKNTATDGKFRPVEVKVSRKGVDVRTRKGYFATPGGGDDVLLPFEQPVLELLAATQPGSRPAELPVMLRTERFRNGQAWTVPIVMHVPGSALAPHEREVEKGAKTPPQVDFELDAIAIVRDSKNNIVAKVSRSFPYRSDKDKVEEFRQLELLNTFSQPIVLSPGAYKISIALYDPNGRKGTVVDRSMVLPALAAGAPTISSIVLSRDVGSIPVGERERLAGDPFVFEGTTRILPNPVGKWVKARGENIVVYFRFYGAPSTAYQVKMEFVKDGKVVNASQPTALPQTDAKGVTAFAPTIPVAGLEPGAYVVRVVVIDPAAGKPVADGSANFRVE